MPKNEVAAAAQDATVATDPDRQRRKEAAAVEYYRRELAVAEEAVARLEEKAKKFEAHAQAARDAVDAARAEATEAADRLSYAESIVDGGNR